MAISTLTDEELAWPGNDIMALTDKIIIKLNKKWQIIDSDQRTGE